VFSIICRQKSSGERSEGCEDGDVVNREGAKGAKIEDGRRKAEGRDGLKQIFRQDRQDDQDD